MDQPLKSCTLGTTLASVVIAFPPLCSDNSRLSLLRIAHASDDKQYPQRSRAAITTIIAARF